MEMTDKEIADVVKMVEVIVYGSSDRPATDCEEVADIIANRIIRRLMRIPTLRKPLSHYVRHRAARELRREFARLDTQKEKELAFAQFHKEEHEEVNLLEQEEIRANLAEGLDRLRAEEREAVLNYYGYEGHETGSRNHYLKNKALRFLREFFEGRNLL